MNILHDIDPGTNEEINTIIEIPKGSKNKYEIDKKTGLIALDRAMHTSQDYPFDYGFIPQTLCDDGDPLDVVVLTTYPLFPGILVKVRPVGLVNMIDNGEKDEKIIAVPCEDPRWNNIKDLEDVNPHTLKEIEHFFLTYKNLQNKKVEIDGFGKKEDAKQSFEQARKTYQNNK